MTSEIIVALIVGVLSFAGTALTSFLSSRKNTAVMSYKIDALEKEVKKHNSVIERTYKLETTVACIEAEIKMIEREK